MVAPIAGSTSHDPPYRWFVRFRTVGVCLPGHFKFDGFILPRFTRELLLITGQDNIFRKYRVTQGNSLVELRINLEKRAF